MTDDQKIQYARTEIAAYLARRPASADTLEGIHRWWIQWPGPEEESLAVTEAALMGLEREGRVVRFRAGNREVWRGVRAGL